MIERTKQRSKTTRNVALLVLTSLVVAACTTGDDGIFATIALERRSTSRNLNDDAAILGVVQTDGDQVFALVGNQVFWRDLSSNTWAGISTPSVSGGEWRPIGLVGLDTNTANGTGVVEELYVHAQFDTTDSSATARTVVFRMSGTSFGSIVLDSAAGASPVETIGGMEAIEDHLVVSTADSGGTYLLYSFDNGFTADDWAGADSHAFPMVGAVSSGQDIVDSDVSSTTALFVGESGGLFRLPLVVDLGSGGAAGTALQLVTLPHSAGSPGPRPRGIDLGTSVVVSGTGSPVGELWIVADGSNDLGRIFVNESPDPNSGAWVEVDTEASLSFSDALWVSGTNSALLVGTFTNLTPDTNTSADGLRRIALTRNAFDNYSGTASDDLGRSYEAVELSDAAIRSLDLVQTTQTTLYAQTSGSGLWSVPSFAETAPDNREWIWE